MKRTAFFCGLMAAAVLMLPSSARAQCSTGWDASGHHLIVQRGTFAFDVTLEQKGRVITGTADAIVNRGNTGYVDTITGRVDGTIDGDSLHIQIFWDNNKTGVYVAAVLPSGRLDGEGYEKSTPNVRPMWNSQGVLKCPPPPAPKPIKSSGKARPAAQPAAAPLTPPFITASPPVRLPNLTFTSVYLGWDGGADHPNAEVWVSINDQTEISAALLYGPVLKQPRINAIELKLQGGQYKYFLKDGGTTLSTVTVVIP